jgi:hypothetical protein
VSAGPTLVSSNLAGFLQTTNPRIHGPGDAE